MAGYSYRKKRKHSAAGVTVLCVIAALFAAVALTLLGLAFLPELLGSGDVSSEPSAPVQTTTTTAPALTYYVTTDKLNVRSGPGTEHSVLATLEEGTIVEVLGTENGWHRIMHNGADAYVSAEYTTPWSESAATTTTAAVTTTTTVAQTKPTLLQYPTEGRYVQATSYADGAAIPWELLLVNDWNPLPAGYDTSLTLVTSGFQRVDKRMQEALNAMLEAGKENGIAVQSGYRAVSKQDELYWRQVNSNLRTGMDDVAAQTAAGQVVKRPGYSEHHTGLAVDLGGNGDFSLTDSFERTAAFAWLKEHCAEYGFILRFPKGKEDITGVIYEPWHYRYVGKEAAKYITENGLCLEEYLELKKQ